MEACNTVLVVVTKTIPKKNKCEKAMWLPEDPFETSEKIRDVNSKGESERNMQWNADFQRIARREKKVFITEKCKNRGKQ